MKKRYPSEEVGLTPAQLTERLFRDDIRQLDDAVADYLEEKEHVWLLIDNLDKGWPTRGASEEDILILRSLIEASGKLQRQLERRHVQFHALVFIRNDIHEHLLNSTPDKGKDTSVSLGWDDPEVFRELVRQRLVTTELVNGNFSEVWPMVFDQHVGTRDSFDYILERTLMRPRDLLNFLQRAIETAINRGHDRVLQADVLQAESTYSEDMLVAIGFELGDVLRNRSGQELLYEFLSCPVELTQDQIDRILAKAGLAHAEEKREALELLVWFGFLGVQSGLDAEPVYAYQARHNLPKVMAPLRSSGALLVVHPAFRRALGCAR